jgi:hypothetical protein
LGEFRPNLACANCESLLRRTIRSRIEGFTAMIRSPGAASGFIRPAQPVTSSRMTDAVAASLALGALSLSLIVTITVLSIKVSMAMPCAV